VAFRPLGRNPRDGVAAGLNSSEVSRSEVVQADDGAHYTFPRLDGDGTSLARGAQFMAQRIEDYGLIGDTQTAALVGRDDSMTGSACQLRMGDGRNSSARDQLMPMSLSRSTKYAAIAAVK
jgi:hypothetical protein